MLLKTTRHLKTRLHSSIFNVNFWTKGFDVAVWILSTSHSKLDPFGACAPSVAILEGRGWGRASLGLDHLPGVNEGWELNVGA